MLLPNLFLYVGRLILSSHINFLELPASMSGAYLHIRVATFGCRVYLSFPAIQIDCGLFLLVNL